MNRRIRVTFRYIAFLLCALLLFITAAPTSYYAYAVGGAANALAYESMRDGDAVGAADVGERLSESLSERFGYEASRMLLGEEPDA